MTSRKRGQLDDIMWTWPGKGQAGGLSCLVQAGGENPPMLNPGAWKPGRDPRMPCLRLASQVGVQGVGQLVAVTSVQKLVGKQEKRCPA